MERTFDEFKNYLESVLNLNLVKDDDNTFFAPDDFFITVDDVRVDNILISDDDDGAPYIFITFVDEDELEINFDSKVKWNLYNIVKVF